MTRENSSAPAWTDEELREAYFRDFRKAYAAIEEHPGAAVDVTLSVLRVSVDLFTDTVDDLVAAVRTFKVASGDPMFWSRAHRARFERMERQIRKALFAATSAALALVDHARRASRDFPVDGYVERLRTTFDEEQHRFVQDLRNFASHASAVIPDWERRYEKGTRETRLLLLPQFLSRFKNWTIPARAFIDKHPNGIELDVLFTDYRERVSDFYGWNLPAIEEKYAVALTEYRRYRRTLQRFGVHSFWMMLLSQLVIPQKLNPYEYLTRYLTPSELDEVNSLPNRSRKQVDRIIALVDDSGACDERLRELVYRAFEVSA